MLVQVMCWGIAAQFKLDLHWYVHTIEDVIIDALAHFGLAAHRLRGYPGVWASGRKIAQVGMNVNKWYTMHGFAINVDPDMAERLLHLFDSLNRLGTTVVVATHDFHTLARIPKAHTMRLEKGRLVDPTGSLRFPPPDPPGAMAA